MQDCEHSRGACNLFVNDFLCLLVSYGCMVSMGTAVRRCCCAGARSCSARLPRSREHCRLHPELFISAVQWFALLFILRATMKPSKAAVGYLEVVNRCDKHGPSIDSKLSFLVRSLTQTLKLPILQCSVPLHLRRSHRLLLKILPCR